MREGTSMRILFDHAQNGLVSRGGSLNAFEISGSDGKFVPARAEIDGTTVVVSSPQVETPAAVRYGWAGNPTCNLYNQDNLPASPFSTQ
jgi:sialate O-acetylesterase